MDNVLYNQVEGTAMGTKCAPPYACLVSGYEEETKLFPRELPKFFNATQIHLFKQVLKRYIDDSFLPCPKSLNFDQFMLCLNNLHPAIEFTDKKAGITKNDEGIIVQQLNFFRCFCYCTQ